MIGWRVRGLVAAVPVGGALVLSFDGLAALARACRIDGWLAYLWPVTLDATGVVASLIWMDARAPVAARRAARWLALAAIVLSVSGNGLWHWLIETAHRPHVLVQIAVGSVPPLVLFAMLHVLQLAGRHPVGHQTPAPPAPATRADTRPPANPWTGLVVMVTAPPTTGEPAGVLDLPPAPAHQPGHPPTSVPAHQTAHPPAHQAAGAGGWPGVGPPADRVVPATGTRPHTIRHAPGAPPARPGGTRHPATWRDHLDTARQVLAEQPAIGRLALATRLGIPGNQARQLLEHLRAAAPEPTASDADTNPNDPVEAHSG